MKIPDNLNFYMRILLIISLVVIDHITKFLIRENLFLGQTIYILPFLNITRIENTGIAFGLFQNYKYSNLIFTAIALLLILIMIFFIKRHTHKWINFSFLLIISGAIGNIIDRIFLGKVTDFIELHIGRYYWPAFNVSDSLITIGAVIIGINILCTRNY